MTEGTRPPAAGPRGGRHAPAWATYGLAGPAVLVVLALVLLTAAGVGPFGSSVPEGSASPVAAASGSESSAGAGSPLPSTSADASPTAPSSPAPSPTPQLVAAPLTGLPVSPDAAARHVIAVMIDDLSPARPQSGFTSASIVWQAPAEGGIPRYMMLFQDQVPGNVGPVRSSRQYFIEWAAEWKAMYVHAGGSPQALATLAALGHGQWVYNADAFRWEGVYLLRVDGVQVVGGSFHPLAPPHNLYTDGGKLGELETAVGAKPGALTPVWSFAADAPLEDRPTGTRLTVEYPVEAIQYRYDPVTNTYRRFISPGGAFKPEIDAATGTQVAPKNVVILKMAFGPLNDGHPDKHRLEASDVGHGTAWISSNGITVKGTWRKAVPTAPTLLFGPDGKPIVLVAGQTFVQVMKLEDTITLKAGSIAPASRLVPGGRSLR